MPQKIFAGVTCSDSSSEEMFKMYVYSDADEYIVLTRRMDICEVGVDFNYRTSDLNMVGYHLNSFFHDYSPDDFSWKFEVYVADVYFTSPYRQGGRSLTNKPSFSALNELIVDKDPIMDYGFDINDYAIHLKRCFAFDKNVAIISEEEEETTFDDLPDLVPLPKVASPLRSDDLSADEMTGILCSSQEPPVVELDKIYESGDEMVFIAN